MRALPLMSDPAEFPKSVELATTCPLCDDSGGQLLVRHAQYRVVLAPEPDYPGFCRVIWNRHVRDMTDLDTTERTLLMAVVWQVEQALRELLQPDKINLASLGNVVPHLHWHVIPRYHDDAHFPQAVWSEPLRTTPAERLAQRRAQLPALQALLMRRLAPFS